ncbi:MAG TPA: DEAD/DEAH box helicase [Candidatus Corynebacterium avicola]|uniref:DEAD/DEAH box helicase n=1 Tax=Candidatus Corynebacterium avicola TaxID=2838527 RepID=A0A9D1RQ35_9CORY|nr:DEAD/DEAH box helicase [Candidatus Corynebacterium avicola]
MSDSYGAELLDIIVPADVSSQVASDTLQDSPLTHSRSEAARPARPVDWPDWVNPALRDHLVDAGISSPWSHQVATAEHAWAGRDVVVSTGTASGKSLGYQLPVLSHLAAGATGAAGGTASCLYLSPTKALAQDQLGTLAQLCSAVPALRHVMVAAYDGDTPTEARRTIRDEARIIVSNPDMVHASILGQSTRWSRLLRTLQFIVVDECHVYRGVFGAHVSLVLRRLLRLAEQAGARPTVILASATTADPAGHAARLTGREVTAVTTDGSPQGERTVALWEPGFIEGRVGEHGAPVRRAATTEAAGIMARLIGEGARTLTFVRSRRGAEVTSLACAEDLATAGRPDDAARIASYRAGYTPEARRELEHRLDNGDLLGLAATSALELGIDVGGLDAVVTCGFPGTVASFRQQAGRAGRRGQGCLVVMVASDNPLDSYLVHHPDALLDTPVEASVFNPSNPYILAGHLLCAAAEAPLTGADVRRFSDSDPGPVHQVIEALLAEGSLRRRPRGLFCDLEIAGQVHGRVNIRGGAGEEVVIVDGESGRVLGTVDAARAVGDVHDGAVYVHQGESFVVDELSLEDSVAVVHPETPEWTTRPQETTDIRVEQVHRTLQVGGTPDTDSGVWLADVSVEVSHQVTGYQRRLSDGEVLETVPLDVPAQRLRTRAVAYTVQPEVLLDLGIEEPLWPGTLHAAEHAAIGLLPLLATCDRWDIGGVSTVLHADTGLPTVYVYDGYAGGAGFAEAGFDRFAAWMAMTADVVEDCGCESGCPSCVQSPKCGNGNDPLFKYGAAVLLRALADAADTADTAAQ